jgi:hypothetical protein
MFRIGVALAALAAIQTATAAHNPRSFSDPTGDSGSALDISGVAVGNTAAGDIRFGIDFANAGVLWRPDNLMAVFVDADRSESTGWAGGFEYTIQIAGAQAFVGAWDGSTFVATPAPSLVWVWSFGRGPWLEISRADLGNTAGFRFWAASEVLPEAGDFDDVAPDGFDAFEYTLATPHVASASAGYSPSAPRAGRRFRVGGVTVTLETHEEVQAATFRCRATLAGRTLRGTGVGRCTFSLPRNARGKRLVVVTTAFVGGQSTMVRGSFGVR